MASSMMVTSYEQLDKLSRGNDFFYAPAINEIFEAEEEASSLEEKISYHLSEVYKKKDGFKPYGASADYTPARGGPSYEIIREGLEWRKNNERHFEKLSELSDYEKKELLDVSRSAYIASKMGYDVDVDSVLEGFYAEKNFERIERACPRASGLESVLERGEWRSNGRKTIHDLRPLFDEMREYGLLSDEEARELEGSVLYHRTGMKGVLHSYLSSVLEASKAGTNLACEFNDERPNRVWVADADARRMVGEAVKKAKSESYKNHSLDSFSWLQA